MKIRKEMPRITVIAKGAKVTGIETDSDLSIAGSVVGDVVGNDITILGEVSGNIKASGKVVLAKSSVVKGTITCLAIEIEEGTHFSNTLYVGVSGSTESEVMQEPEEGQE